MIKRVLLKIANLRVFPVHWDWRRIAELWILGYVTVTGCIFWVHPHSLASPVYLPMTSLFNATQWAIVMWSVAVGHAVSLWLNGTCPKFSPVIRTTACFIHFGLLALIANTFHRVEAYWPVGTMVFISVLVFAALSVSIQDLAKRYAA